MEDEDLPPTHQPPNTPLFLSPSYHTHRHIHTLLFFSPSNIVIPQYQVKSYFRIYIIITLYLLPTAKLYYILLLYFLSCIHFWFFSGVNDYLLFSLALLLIYLLSILYQVCQWKYTISSFLLGHLSVLIFALEDIPSGESSVFFIESVYFCLLGLFQSVSHEASSSCEFSLPLPCFQDSMTLFLIG